MLNLIDPCCQRSRPFRGRVLECSSLPTSFRETSYSPLNLSSAFIEWVRDLRDVPEGLPYVSDRPRSESATIAPPGEVPRDVQKVRHDRPAT